LAREKKAREDAETANRVKDEFLATVSHELRTPLNAIYGWAHMLTERALPPETVARGLDAIQRNARAQTQLIDDLLDVSRIISGKMRIEMVPVSLSGAIEHALETVRPAAKAKEIRLHPSFSPDVGTVIGDAIRLQQILWNLLSNAVKFTQKGGEIRVDVREDGAYLRIEVKDSGLGISAEFLPLVFDRFRQADGTIARRYGGLGLGLAIVRNLVELHCGTIEARSEGEGHGSTFIVRLPAVSQLAARVRPISDAAPNSLDRARAQDLQGVRVLIVDDEEDGREVLESLLRSCNANVISASNAADALSIIESQPIDALISDVGMPGEDGFALIRKVRALPADKGGNVPAIALTAYARVDDRTRALLAGFTAHVAKPVEPTELVVVLANLVGRLRTNDREP
jgi:CheY-like chemotaxis protein